MKDKTTVILVVVLMALVGVYVWHSQRIHKNKLPESVAATPPSLSPKKALSRKVVKAINTFKKEKGSVPRNLEELKGRYLDEASYKKVKKSEIEYVYVNPQAYRLTLPTSTSAPITLAAKKPKLAAQPTLSPQGLAVAEILPVDTGWKYDPQGKPDPFKSFIVAMAPKPVSTQRRQPLTPLQKMPLSEIQTGLKAIVWGAMGTKALVEDATGKGYVIQEGTYLGQNDGIVKKIFSDKIVVEEYRRDPLEGHLQTHEVVLKLRKGEGEQ